MVVHAASLPLYGSSQSVLMSLVVICLLQVHGTGSSGLLLAAASLAISGGAVARIANAIAS